METRIESLEAVLNGHSQLLIIPHNDPDPDAIAAAIGLRYLVEEKWKIKAHIGYRGIIGRAENKALVRYLNNPLFKLGHKDFQQNLPIALVDTQPGVGNNPLPHDIPASIVFDHHNLPVLNTFIKFADIRPEIGSTATILTEYIQYAGLDFPRYLATTLFYGIKTDTMGLGRGASSNDAAAYFLLQPKVDAEALAEIERAQVPSTYFKNLTSAFQSTLVYEGDLVISTVGMMKYPDLGAEIADSLLRLQGAIWVVCFGIYKDDLILSIRSRSQQIGAGTIARYVIGNRGTAGGHGTMAGGQIRLRDQNPVELIEQLTRLALQRVKGDIETPGTPLV